MRLDEQLVGSCLATYFGGSEKVSVNEGDDPPDIYLNFSDSCIGVEVTQLRPPTIEQGRPLGNRTTQDLFGIRLVNELNIDAVISGQRIQINRRGI